MVNHSLKGKRPENLVVQGEETNTRHDEERRLQYVGAYSRTEAEGEDIDLRDETRKNFRLL